MLLSNYKLCIVKVIAAGRLYAIELLNITHIVATWHTNMTTHQIQSTSLNLTPVNLPTRLSLGGR